MEIVFILFWVFAAMSALAILQWLGILSQLRKFLERERHRHESGEAVVELSDKPGDAAHASLSIIVPIKGADESSKTALESWLQLPLGAHVEILFVMEEESDPAYSMVQSILSNQSTQAGDNSRIILSGQCTDGMGKLHNMREGVAQAAHDHILFLDADVELTMEVIEQGLKSIADRKVGAVSAIPLYRNPVAWGETMITAWTNDYFLPCLLGLRQMKSFPFVIGACFFTRRDVLTALDQLEGAEKYISDDAFVAERVGQAGLETRVLAHAVTMSESKTASEGWHHLLRWFVMLRRFNPLVYLSIHNWHAIYISVLTVIIALFTGSSPHAATAVCLCIAAVVAKLLGSIWFNNQLKVKEPLGRYVKIIFYELFIFPGVWLTGMWKSTLIWRGRKYKVGAKGIIRRVTED